MIEVFIQIQYLMKYFMMSLIHILHRLILQVEYSAASDAYTHAPEGFNEFYNQRRRWVPSTIANIMDLLMDAKRTIKINDNISLPYISYQILLMGQSNSRSTFIFLLINNCLSRHWNFHVISTIPLY